MPHFHARGRLAILVAAMALILAACPAMDEADVEPVDPEDPPDPTPEEPFEDDADGLATMVGTLEVTAVEGA